MKKLIGHLAGKLRSGSQARPRLQIDLEPDDVIYAVGDVHGMHDQLLALTEVIAEDAARYSGRKWIIMLGDYVDRGPASAAVIEHLVQPPPAPFQRICLAGNHEIFMLDHRDGRLPVAEWLTVGGGATIQSYGVEDHHTALVSKEGLAKLDKAVRAAVPAPHVRFLRDLPVLVQAGRFLFVHAGLRPGVPIEAQTDSDLVFIRASFLQGPPLPDRIVVHGHTPITQPKFENGRVNLDTGAYFSGRLTALRIYQNTGRFLSTG